MKVPLSWLKDFVDIQLPVEDLARKLTAAGLEVEGIRYVGLPKPEAQSGERHEFKSDGIAWDREKIVVAEVYEVMPHPNADRLVLCDLFDGKEKHIVLTGAPNLYPYKGQGKLPKPIKVAYAKEGATLYDGHADGQTLMTLKRTRIRGVESYSMACSEKELGISDDHEGIIFLDDDAIPGTPLADYMGDVVLDISILPNMARCANILGIAREVAALTGQPLKKPQVREQVGGSPIRDFVKIKIENPELNPRFVLGLIRNVEIKPSPYWVQRRLRLAGMRPINNVVDATNYTMLEIGEPLHAFDYDVLVRRAGGNPVTIITRTARPGEKLTTLDGVERTLSESNVLVCDSAGALSIAGVMGGQESEITESTRNILLEGAAWNFINIRRTAREHNLPSEASYRFSRGVHPALADMGVRRCMEWMADWAGGVAAPDLVDAYPLPPVDPVVEVTPRDVRRLLGIEISVEQIADLLQRVEFECKVDGDKVIVKTPPYRMDIGDGVVGLADVLEEVARLYGIENIPETRMADPLPPQLGNPDYEKEEHLRDILVNLGLQEVITYRPTSAEREARLGISGEAVRIANPIAPERSILRRSLLASVLDVAEKNIRLRETLAFFEIGPVFVARGNDLPDEPHKLAIVLTGKRYNEAWDSKSSALLDFYDLKGIIAGMLDALALRDVTYEPSRENPIYHPGKCATIVYKEKTLGVFGELHPTIKTRYDFGSMPVLGAEFDLDILLSVEPVYAIRPVPEFPPVFEDIAVVVDDVIPAAQVEALIRQTGGKMVASVRLFDVFRGEQIGAGKKSLAYNLTYQADNKTLTDDEVAAIRNKIIQRLQRELGAVLRT
jgi:phenylalanyl-tRNA synthetase beta chain